MSTPYYIYTCEEIGACQDRPVRCAGCRPLAKDSAARHSQPEAMQPMPALPDQVRKAADARACAIFWRAVAVVYLAMLAILIALVWE